MEEKDRELHAIKLENEAVCQRSFLCHVLIGLSMLISFPILLGLG